jgi:hypothetical protein
VNFKEIFQDVSQKEYAFWTICLIAMVLFLYPGDESFYLNILSSGSSSSDLNEYGGYIYHHIATLFIFGLPFWSLHRLKLAPDEKVFMTLGDWKWGAKWTVISLLIAVGPTYFSSFDPEFTNEYPLSPLAFESARLYIIFHLSYILYYIGWEGFFRGFIGYGALKLGYRPFVALMIQVSLSSIIHIGKPSGELIGAIPGGIWMGVLAYRSRSIMWPFLFHVALGFLNSYFCWMNG